MKKTNLFLQKILKLSLIIAFFAINSKLFAQSVVWNGSIDTDWNNAKNWTPKGVPGVTDNVIIANVISHNSPVINDRARCNSIVIDASASLTNDSTLRVYGDFTNNGTYTDNGTTRFLGLSNPQVVNGVVTFNNLVIKNDFGVTLNNTVIVKGVLTLSSGALNSNGNLTVNLNLGAISGGGDGNIVGNITCRKTIPNIGFHEVGNPLNGASIPFSQWGTTAYIGSSSLYEYIETSNSVDKQQGWNSIYGPYNAQYIQSMKGYGINFFYNATLYTTGAYDHNLVPAPINITNTNSGNADADGWNLIANPYPSPIDWDATKGWTKINVDNAIYFWDNASGQNVSYVDGVGVPTTVTSTIPSMQAFWVHCTNPGSGSVGVKNKVRTTSSNPSVYRTMSPSSGVLRLKIYDGVNINDETVIRLKDYATNSFDSKFDAYKVENGVDKISLYSIINNVKYSVNSLSKDSLIHIIPLNLSVPTNKLYTFTAIGIETFGAEYSICLIDSLLNITTDLKDTVNYSTNVTSHDATGRFFLKLRKEHVDIIDIIDTIDVVNNTKDGLTSNKIIIGSDVNNKINIIMNNNTEQQQSISLYTMHGVEVYNEKLNENISSLSYNKSGLYIIKLKTDKNEYTEKVLIK